MKNKTGKQVLALTLTAIFAVISSGIALARRPSGAGRPSGGQRPPNAGRENSPYKDKYKNGQRRPPESRTGSGRPQGTFLMPQGTFPRS